MIYQGPYLLVNFTNLIDRHECKKISAPKYIKDPKLHIIHLKLDSSNVQYT